MTRAVEVNFDGIVGPSHNYSGLSYGNLASHRHHGRTANPREAALQGLEKMRLVRDLGIPQAVLPPPRRPRLDLLRALGFEGSDPARLIEAAWRVDPVLVASCYGASSMWAANAATVSPSPDCGDSRLHVTPANLSSGLHRSIEAAETHAVLARIFADESVFCLHPPLPAAAALADEGAANHTRLCPEPGERGLELFVYGQSAMDNSVVRPKLYPARQTLEASRAIARHHRLSAESTLFVQQNPAAIDAGVFHNDVISVGNRNLLLVHEDAFVECEATLGKIRSAWQGMFGEEPLHLWRVERRRLSLDEAVSSYLFNSQLLSRPDGGMTLLCPAEVRKSDSARSVAEAIAGDDNPVSEVRYVDLRQSMNNGGGPACLRLRVSMTPDEFAHVHPGVLLDDALYERLVDWAVRHYRTELSADDLRDPALVVETCEAIDELETILEMPSSSHF